MKKNNNKGFKLIELFVVVAFIGALAAVGVVAYNGYTAAAKKNSTKAIHSNIVKFVASEVAKCNLDSKPFGTLDCPTSASDVVTELTGTSASIIKDKNPFSSTSSAVSSATVASNADKSNLGWTAITEDGDDVVFSTWYDNGEDMMETKVTIE